MHSLHLCSIVTMKVYITTWEHISDCDNFYSTTFIRHSSYILSTLLCRLWILLHTSTIKSKKKLSLKEVRSIVCNLLDQSWFIIQTCLGYSFIITHKAHYLIKILIYPSVNYRMSIYEFIKFIMVEVIEYSFERKNEIS